MNEGDGKEVLTLVAELRVLPDEDSRLLNKLWPLRADEFAIKEAIRGNERQLAAVLLKIIGAVHTDSAKRDLLRFSSVLCRDVPTFASAFAMSPEAKTFVSQPLAEAPDVLLLCVANVLRNNEDLTPAASGFLRQVLSVLEAAPKDAKGYQKDVEGAMKALTVFLRRKALRDAFRTAGGLPHLPAMIHLYCVAEIAVNVQLLYDILFTCWVSLFDPLAIDILHRRKIIPVVHDVLKRSAKEKCIRASLLILDTLLTMQTRYSTGEDSNLAVMSTINNGKGPRFFTDMSGIGMLKTIQILQKRNWEDQDVVAQLAALEKQLHENLDDLTTFSEYVGEVHSGVLEWSPAHTSVKFWKENLRNFEAKEYEILRELAELLKTTTHDVTLAVACFDFGEFLRHHPQGRKILALPQFAGVKEKILSLMSHESPEVARHALLATQKIMVQRWEFLGGRD
jgi:V-type H+-transporting ATPase subunit H